MSTPEPDIEILDESGRWRARDVTYWTGKWAKLAKVIPQFAVGDFRIGDRGPANPYMKSVIRQPLTAAEQPTPVGVVSNTYSLVQHPEVIERCFDGLRFRGIKTDDLQCELGLTALGEWMNFVELRDIHNIHLDLERIPEIVGAGLDKVDGDLKRLKNWEDRSVNLERLELWANKRLSDVWGKKAACRVFHICRDGRDVEITDPFAPGRATEKPVKKLEEVPGAAKPASTLYDVSQALSWVATGRNNTEERLDWQTEIPGLIAALQKENAA